MINTWKSDITTITQQENRFTNENFVDIEIAQYQNAMLLTLAWKLIISFLFIWI